MNAVGKEKALKLIGQQLKAIPALRNQSAGSTEFKTWEQTTSLYVEKIFGSDSKNIKAFNKITFRTFVWEDGMDGTGADQTYRERQSLGNILLRMPQPQSAKSTNGSLNIVYPITGYFLSFLLMKLLRSLRKCLAKTRESFQITTGRTSYSSPRLRSQSRWEKSNGQEFWQECSKSRTRRR